MNPEMQAATYMAGKPAFALKPIPPGDKGKGLRKMAASDKGAAQVKDFGYDPATAMKPAYAMGNLDNLRNEKGVITPSAMKLDPGGFYTDFKVPTPDYLKEAGYGFNPDQKYTFRYRGSDNKPFRTDTPLSQEEYDAGGYKLLSAIYKPVQNPNINIGTDTKGYNRLKPVTSKLPSSDDSQRSANMKNNPYITQVTQFGNKDGNLSQRYTRNIVSRDFDTRIKYDKDGNPFKGFKQIGAESIFITRPGEGTPSNVMTNFGSFRFENKRDLPTYNFTRKFRSSGDPSTPINPTYNIGVLGSKYSAEDKGDQKLFRQSVGPAMTNILKGLKFESKKSGETFPRFRSKF